MSYSILLVVERPDLSTPDNETKWENWTKNTQNTSTQDTSLEALSENVVVLRLSNALSKIGEALACLSGLKYKYMIFDTDIQWHEVAKDG